MSHYTKKQIKVYARKNNLIWFEDRSNFELDYTRNKVRSYLTSNPKISKFIEKDKNKLIKILDLFVTILITFYFEKASKKRFEIRLQRVYASQQNSSNDCCTVFILQFEIEVKKAA